MPLYNSFYISNNYYTFYNVIWRFSGISIAILIMWANFCSSKQLHSLVLIIFIWEKCCSADVVPTRTTGTPCQSVRQEGTCVSMLWVAGAVRNYMRSSLDQVVMYHLLSITHSVRCHRKLRLSRYILLPSADLAASSLLSVVLWYWTCYIYLYHSDRLVQHAHTDLMHARWHIHAPLLRTQSLFAPSKQFF